MAFIDGCACHVWAISGWVDDLQAAAANTAYANEANRLLLAGGPLGDINARVQHLVNHVRGAVPTVLTARRATFYGGWQNGTDAAPEHMWFIYGSYIYDTMPGAPLRRKRAWPWNHRHPPSEAHSFPGNSVGHWRGYLTQSQYQVIQQANWHHNEYTP